MNAHGCDFDSIDERQEEEAYIFASSMLCTQRERETCCLVLKQVFSSKFSFHYIKMTMHIG